MCWGGEDDARVNAMDAPGVNPPMPDLLPRERLLCDRVLLREPIGARVRPRLAAI